MRIDPYTRMLPKNVWFRGTWPVCAVPAVPCVPASEISQVHAFWFSASAPPAGGRIYILLTLPASDPFLLPLASNLQKNKKKNKDNWYIFNEANSLFHKETEPYRDYLISQKYICTPLLIFKLHYLGILLFTFMHLADAFIQSDLHSCKTFFSVCVFPGNWTQDILHC